MIYTSVVERKKLFKQSGNGEENTRQKYEINPKISMLKIISTKVTKPPVFAGKIELILTF